MDLSPAGSSICEALLDNGIDIEHACEMSSACTTCHVIVRKGFESLNAVEESEEDLLDRPWGLEAQSRLSCQAILGNEEVTVDTPKYTINHARETRPRIALDLDTRGSFRMGIPSGSWFGFNGAFEEPGVSTIRFAQTEPGMLGGSGTAAVNGGVIAAGFDAALVLAGLGHYETEVVVTLDLSVQFLSLARDSNGLVFRACVTRSARHFAFIEAELVDLHAGADAPLATSRGMVAPRTTAPRQGRCRGLSSGMASRRRCQRRRYNFRSPVIGE